LSSRSSQSSVPLPCSTSARVHEQLSRDFTCNSIHNSTFRESSSRTFDTSFLRTVAYENVIRVDSRQIFFLSLQQTSEQTSSRKLPKSFTVQLTPIQMFRASTSTPIVNCASTHMVTTSTPRNSILAYLFYFFRVVSIHCGQFKILLVYKFFRNGPAGCTDANATRPRILPQQ
jgi:hypothetical protein